MKNNEKLLIVSIFLAAILSLSFLTLSSYVFRKTLSGTIKTEKIKISFNPSSNSDYEKDVSSTVTVTNMNETSFSDLKYVWSNTEENAEDGTSFVSGDEIVAPNVEGEYYLCVYAKDENDFYNNKCSNKFYVDNKAPVIEFSTEEISGTNYLVVEVTEEGSGLKSLVSNENLVLTNQEDNKYYYELTDDSILSFTATDNLDNTVTKTYAFCERLEGHVYNYNYTGDVQIFNPLCNGIYQLEVWGAKGGGSNGGRGGYSVGYTNLAQEETLYIGVGGAGRSSGSVISGGYNGGGYNRTNEHEAGAGGGATHIAKVTGTLAAIGYESFVTEKNGLIVAGGGGGVTQWHSGGAGGGLSGTGGSQAGGSPGTQTSGNAFGQGGNGQTSYTTGGGGGGFYGGTGGTANGTGGYGGSGWIDGVIEGQTIAGNAAMPKYDGTTGTMVGNNGNGYARIKYLGENPKFTISFSPNNGVGGQSDDVQAKYNQTLPELNASEPTREGYIFVGYYDNADYTQGTKYYDSNLNPVKTLDSLNNVTLYAGWVNTIVNYNYTGEYQEFDATFNGIYVVELWGGAGTGTAYGGYTKGNIYLTEGDKLYLYVGPSSITGNNKMTFNNGTGDNGGYNGGGATDVRLVKASDTKTVWNTFDSLKSRIMVAGAGGSGSGTQGAGGGLTGYAGGGTQGGTQTTFGAKQTSTSYANSSFGIANGGCTGGNGYYPGGGATCASGAGGGSSFISGHAGCNAIAEESTSGNIVHTGQPNHYSGYIFKDTVMIDGQGYNWTNKKGNNVGQPQPDGTTATGHSGNGYARITYLGENPEFTISFSANNGVGGQSANVEVNYDNEMPVLDYVIPTREGYTFMGYYDNPNYTQGTKYYNVNGTPAKTYDKFSNTTLYAGWKINSGISEKFDYTGEIEEYNITATGLYKLEVWGAQGGDATATFVGGNGGYSMGYAYLEENDILYYAIGGKGENITGATKTCLGGFNGGGTGKTYTGSSSATAGGGGATHIGLFNSTLADHGTKDDLLIVAGGGGGGHFTNTSNQSVGGVGGGLEGSEPTNMSNDLINNRGERISVGGKQDSISCTMSGKYCSSFGQGANAVALNVVGSGGGGGLYGGSTGLYSSGAGGSSYIDGVIDGITISGNAEMPSYLDNSTMIGNSGNGHIRITYIEPNPSYTVSFSANNGIGGQSDNITVNYGLTMPTLNYAIPTRDNYVFMGYYDNPNYELGEKYYNVDGSPVKTYDRAKNITLYAGWKGVNLTVTFDANGGVVDTPSKTVEYNKTYLELPTPTREDYNFIGWNGKNIFNIYAEESLGVNQNFADTSKRKYIDNTYVIGISANNNYDSSIVSDLNIKRDNNIIQFTTDEDYGVAYAYADLATGNYTLSYNGTSSDGDAKVAIMLYDNNGNFISKQEVTGNGYNTKTFAVTNNTKYTVILLTTTGSNCDVEFGNIQLEKGNIATIYENYYVTEDTNVSAYYNHTLKAIWSNNVVYNYNYTGAIQSLKIPTTGLYRLEVWGASGGNGVAQGGLGGYSSGEVNLTANSTIYIVVGNQGATATNSSTNVAGGYNGGGTANYSAGSGGGATNITTQNKVLSSQGNKTGLYIVAAGGGGGSGYDATFVGGNGGDLQGEAGQGPSAGTGASQTAGGTVLSTATGTKGANGSFGAGGKGGNQFSFGAGGAGAGLYGGAGGSSYNASGAGGSSYIDGVINGSTIGGVNVGPGKAKITYLGDKTIYEITLDPNNGIGGLNYNLKVYNGHEMPIIEAAMPVRVGYEFVGYYDNPDYKNGNKYYNADGTPTRNYDLLANTTLYAGWKIVAGTEEDFDYTGSMYEYNITSTGVYRIEAWGAQGGDDANSVGGKGGYSSGYINLVEDDKLYIYVGQKGPANSSQTNKGGWNGGGHSGSNSGSNSYGGGGATDIRLVKASDTVTTWNEFNSLKSRILVAAGGGGTFSTKSYTRIPGSAGGLIGYDANGSYNATMPKGATQTSVGTGTNASKNGLFGYAVQTNVSGWGGGGGGGYYGGGQGSGVAGSGGSSYISGHKGCNSITETSTASAIVHTGSENHYSGYVFEGTTMIDGEGYIWSDDKGNYVGQPQPDGTYEAGHSGNGYAKITYLGTQPYFTVSFSSNNGAGGRSDNVTEQYQTEIDDIEFDIPVRTGYIFTGYYDNPDYKEGRMYYDKYGHGQGNFDVAGNKTLYAGWQATAGISVEFDYTGKMQFLNVTATGVYKLETWGASGGKYSDTVIGGYGGYSMAHAKLYEDDKLYIGVGGAGSMATSKTAVSIPGGYNGGGNGFGNTDKFVGSGGGATHIGFFNETLASHGNNDGLIIVAGGGGGSGFQSNSAYGNGGNGGGYIGNDGTRSATNYPQPTGGTQTEGGTGYNQSGAANNGTFGQGSGITAASGTGAGGGYYGGGSGRYYVGASGGSGFINGSNIVTANRKMVCYDCAESTDIPTYTISNECVLDSATPNCSKLGNGYAKITFLGAHPEYMIAFSSNNGVGGQSSNVIAGYDSEMPAISTVPPTRENFVFMGWYDTPEYLDGTKYYNADGTSARTYDRLENLTLYAGWEGIPVDVTFDIGEGQMDDPTTPLTKVVNYSRTYGEMPMPGRDSFGFIGWHLKNFFDINVEESEPSETDADISTQRIFGMGTYAPGLSVNNGYDASKVSNVSINNNILSFTADANYGVGYVFKGLEKTAHTLSYTGTSSNGNNKIVVLYYDDEGNYLSNVEHTGNSDFTFTPINDSVYQIILFTTTGTNADMTYGSIQLEKGNTSTSYEEYTEIEEDTVVTKNYAHTLYANWIDVPVGTQWIFNYTGAMQSFEAPAVGVYQLEVWGGQGGSSKGAAGGYSIGKTRFNTRQVVYIGVGGNAQTFNGGAKGDSNYTGGGGTHIGKTNNEIALTDPADLYIVAGGGGAGNGYNGGGAGGGLTGGTGGSSVGANDENHGVGGYGGSQTAGGAARSASSNDYGSRKSNPGSYGQGGVGYSLGGNTSAGGGGGGYYGGGGGLANGYNSGAAGGGGSGYIGGVTDGLTFSGVNTGDGKVIITYLGASDKGSFKRKYQELEYIEAKGSQRIDTDYILKPNTGITARFQYTATTASQRLFGIYTESNKAETLNYLFWINGSTKFAYSYNDKVAGYVASSIAPGTTEHTLEFNMNNNKKVKIDETELSITTTPVNTGTKTMPIFVGYNLANDSYANYSKVILYSFKIYEDDTLVADFVPCKLRYGSSVGLCDKLTGKMYHNTGSGMFNAGPAID